VLPAKLAAQFFAATIGVLIHQHGGGGLLVTHIRRPMNEHADGHPEQRVQQRTSRPAPLAPASHVAYRRTSTRFIRYSAA
jgi:hypothetical protein